MIRDGLASLVGIESLGSSGREILEKRGGPPIKGLRTWGAEVCDETLGWAGVELRLDPHRIDRVC